MSSYIINVVKDPHGTPQTGTIIADIGFTYENNLNDLNNARLNISGTSESKRGLIESGSEVYIYRNGTLELKGIIDSISYLDAGGISATINGYEVWLGKENGTYSNSPYTSTASATIAGDIIGESNYFTAGTTETGSDIDFRISEGDSLFNALKRLIDRVGQDIQIDYTNDEVDILNHKGNSTSQATLNDGIHMKNVVARKSYPIANYVKVYGKGDGDEQIKSTSAHGQDATSQSTYGTITKIVREPTIMSEDEANELADKLVAKYKDPVKVYEFEVINYNLNVESGDVITLNSQTKGLDNEEVRIVSVQRGTKGGKEYLNLEVTNKEYSIKTKKIEQRLAELENNQKRQETFMQGTSNVLTFSEMINANNSVPLRIFAYLPSAFIEDEAGNNRVNSFTLDYDVDGFRSSAGTATEEDTEPTFTGSSATDDPWVSGTSGSQTPNSVSGVSVWASYTVHIDDYNNQALSHSVENITGGPSLYSTRAVCLGANMTGSSQTADLTVEFPSGSSYNEGNQSLNNNTVRYYSIGESYSSNRTGWFHFYDDNYNITYHCGTGQNIYAHTHGSHSHGDGSYKTDLHGHGDGSYVVGSHNHNVSIGDPAVDDEDLNATELSEIKLYHYNTGTSSWDLKNTITNTGKTLDTEVDISDGGTYPDASGIWKVEIKTDNSDPDLVQGVIKCKHQMDN